MQNREQYAMTDDERRRSVVDLRHDARRRLDRAAAEREIEGEAYPEIGVDHQARAARWEYEAQQLEKYADRLAAGSS